jgi:ArsR family transcriptional regulator
MPAKHGLTVSSDAMCCPPIGQAPLSDAEAVELARAYGALADPARLRILSLIASAGAGEICVCDLGDPVGKSQPTVSHHLKILSDAGLITGDKRGRWVWYRAIPTRMAELRAALGVTNTAARVMRPTHAGG